MHNPLNQLAYVLDAAHRAHLRRDEADYQRHVRNAARLLAVLRERSDPPQTDDERHRLATERTLARLSGGEGIVSSAHRAQAENAGTMRFLRNTLVRS